MSTFRLAAITVAALTAATAVAGITVSAMAKTTTTTTPSPFNPWPENDPPGTILIVQAPQRSEDAPITSPGAVPASLPESTRPPAPKPGILTPDLLGDWIGRWSSSSGFANSLYLTFTESRGGKGKGKLYIVVATTGIPEANRDIDFTATERGEQLVIATTDGSFTVTLSRVGDHWEGKIQGPTREFSVDYLKKRR